MGKGGCLVYIYFFLWLGIAIGIPSLIWGFDSIRWPCILATGFGLPLGAAFSNSENSSFFRKELPFTYTHFIIFVFYAVIGMIVIGFTNISYESMKSIGQCSVFYAGMTILVCIVESIFTKNKRQE